MSNALVRRILARLEQAEAREVNPHFQTDYRIAWIALLRAARGERIPFITASYTVLGLHPDKVFPAIEARRRAILGAFYNEGDSEGRRNPAHTGPPQNLPPKKAVQSVRLMAPTWRRTA
jgi:hypothetical protein